MKDEKKMTELTKLFSPGKIGKMELKNRLIQAPTMGIAPFHGVSLPEEAKEDYIPPGVLDYFAERAKGGVSLTLGQSCTILPEARAPGRAGCWDDKFIPGLTKFAEAIHEHEAKVSFQLLHHGRLLTAHSKGMPHPEEIDPIAPSAIPWGYRKEVAREATLADIRHIVGAFAEAARRLKDAGFDAVELKGAHGYCIGQFLSPHSNRRTDEYGGSVQNRARFACEIIRAIKERTSPDFPVIFLMSGSEFIKDGIWLEDSLAQAMLFESAGADALHVEGGVADMTAHITNPCYIYPDALFADHAAAIKKVVSIPIIAGGKIGDPVLANQILEEGKADFVSMARALIADPQLPNKAREGKFDEITQCLWCNNCWDVTWRKSFKEYGVRSCTVNPAYNREKEFTIEPTRSPKKVLVVGGGLAGMEAARVLSRRGHRVELCEETTALGGQWNVASLIKAKQHYARLAEQMSRSLRESGVSITFGQAVTTDVIRQREPDVLVVATGARPRTLNIPGAQGENVVQAVDVLRGRTKVGQRVVVVGGRYLGIEAAILLAEQGKDVSLVTERNLGQNSRYMERYKLLALRDKLVEQGVHIYPHSPVLEIYEDGLYVMNGVDPLFLKADTVVLAVGFSPSRGLLEEVQTGFPELEVHAIGDCVEARDALEAIREGADVGRLV
jgi:2,4-dienoyl-CoA reductase-like NADH-dependent reductase (Old Yellow Enzyme family)/thioredoxin reductase